MGNTSGKIKFYVSQKNVGQELKKVGLGERAKEKRIAFRLQRLHEQKPFNLHWVLIPIG